MLKSVSCFGKLLIMHDISDQTTLRSMNGKIWKPFTLLLDNEKRKIKSLSCKVDFVEFYNETK